MAFETYPGDAICIPEDDLHLPDNLLQDVNNILHNFPPEKKSFDPLSAVSDSVQSKCSRPTKKQASADWTRYRGIRRRPWGKFAAEVTNPKKKRTRMWLGTFDTPEEAAFAYDKAAFELHGSRAKLNFPLLIGSAGPTPKLASKLLNSQEASLSPPAASSSSSTSVRKQHKRQKRNNAVLEQPATTTHSSGNNKSCKKDSSDTAGSTTEEEVGSECDSMWDFQSETNKFVSDCFIPTVGSVEPPVAEVEVEVANLDLDLNWELHIDTSIFDQILDENMAADSNTGVEAADDFPWDVLLENMVEPPMTASKSEEATTTGDSPSEINVDTSIFESIFGGNTAEQPRNTTEEGGGDHSLWNCQMDIVTPPSSSYATAITTEKVVW
ncbi:uncharacterized protein LOC143572746 [Bidens hawaiensis]|uniref:uncharacterized protein LOC143572746 n=1 Tax=Bidens hawaiensis TaxID=980011 RepID=UPI00404AE08D